MNTSKLQKLITENKLNKVQIAKKCGFTRATLDNVLQGADVKISTVETLARILGVSVGYFFDDFSPEDKLEKESPLNDRLISIIESQQRTIESLTGKIK